MNYSCKSGDVFTVKASLVLDKDITLKQKKYILYAAYLQGGWQEAGGYNIDGDTYFEERWDCLAKITDYKINGYQADITIEIPTKGIKTGNRTFVLSVFPYDNYTTGGSLYDCLYFVNIT